MADSKLTALTATTAPATTDILYVVTTPGGTPDSKKVTIADLSTAMGVAGGILTGGRVLISEQTPTSTGTVTFNSIAGTYKHLEIEIVGRTDKAATNVSGCYLYFNNDTTAGNYQRQSVSSQSTSVSSGTASNSDCISLPGAGATANYPGYTTILIPFYALTVFNKSASVKNIFTYAATNLNWNDQPLAWHNTAAITRIDIVTDDSSNYVTGTTFRLYGVY